jgi:molybdopterin synthase catalytic subunit
VTSSTDSLERVAAGALVDRALDAPALIRSVSHAGAGAVVTFIGTVRDEHLGRRVVALDYAAYAPMAERELQAIAEEASRRWAAARVAVAHRVGALALGESSVAIAVSHPHRGPAFDACRWVLETIKRRVPIWKREHYADGTIAWVDAREGTAPTPDVRDEPAASAD